MEQQITDPGQLRALKRMMSAGQRMTDMIEQMLDLTRARLLDGSGLGGSRRPIDLTKLVQRTVEELGGANPGRQITLSASAVCSTTGDPDRLLQLFSNLIGNAIHHGEAGTPVHVDVACNGEDVSVRVHNAGAIPPELMPTLFDPFRRRQGLHSNSQGLGLGLYISQQIAQAHDGSVTVESSSDVGTAFTVRIPKRESEAPVRTN